MKPPHQSEANGLAQEAASVRADWHPSTRAYVAHTVRFWASRMRRTRPRDLAKLDRRVRVEWRAIALRELGRADRCRARISPSFLQPARPGAALPDK